MKKRNSTVAISLACAATMFLTPTLSPLQVYSATATVSQEAVVVLKSEGTGETIGTEADQVMVDHTAGKLTTVKFKDKNGAWITMPFSVDRVGPTWNIGGTAVVLTQSTEDSHLYTGTADGVTYGIRYSVLPGGIFNIEASAKNTTASAKTFNRASLVLGVDTYMKDTYDSYKNLFFPTLVRCENTHAWGYYQSPENKIISMAVDEPVSSYRLDYESGAHRIRTTILDVMQKDETLPARHPRNNYTVEAGATRTWNVKLKLTDTVEQVKEDVTAMVSAPSIEVDRHTLGEGEASTIRVYSKTTIDKIKVDKLDNGNAPNVRSKDGETDTLTTTYTPQADLTNPKVEGGVYTFKFQPGAGVGVYRLQVQGGEFKSEAMITYRNTWKWYMQNAKKAAIEHPAKAADCCESWYGLYSGFIGEKYFPDAQQDAIINASFDNIYSVVGYDENGVPKNNAARTQNHSTTVGILVDKFMAQHNLADLDKASKIADYVMGKQRTDGGYQGPSGDYTSVIYPAKSIMELMKAEKTVIAKGLDTTGIWQQRYDKQYNSVKRAMDNLVNLKGDLHTEGQLTFEDGAFSCSATQISEFALMHEKGTPEYEKYKQSAIDYMTKHEALEQQIIPDSRMVGASLRFWEAQYDTLLTSSPNNMLNSPHGWSAWNIYGLFNIYRLTGDVKYLKRGMNAMGTCAQLMGFDGNLYWAFIADPYIKGGLSVQVPGDTSEYGAKKKRDVTIGETYVDMITDWWRTPLGQNVGGYYGQGGSCDNDVHEIFKTLEENVLTKAYVYETVDGTYETYNCKLTKQADGTLVIEGDTKELTSEVVLNMKKAQVPYKITYSDGSTKSGVSEVGVSSVVENEVTIPATAFTLNKNELTLLAGNSERLSATVEPSNATNRVVTYSSSDSKIAEVDVGGKVTGIQQGQAVITATLGNLTKECVVTVTPQTPPEAGMMYLSDMNWQSASTGYSTVKKDKNVNDGVITLKVDGVNKTFDKGLGAHAASTIIYNIIGKGAARFQCTVGVDASQGTKGSVIFNVYGDGELKFTSGETPLTGASEAKKIDIDIAGVKELKLVADAGENNGNDHSMWADAKLVWNTQSSVPVESVSLSKSTLTLDVGKEETLMAKVTPDTATEKTPIWMSSDMSVARVDSTGKVTAVKAGTATITAMVGGKTATCEVTVTETALLEAKVTLEGLVAQAEGISAKDYKEEGITKLNVAIATASDLLKDSEATYTQVQAASALLRDAIAKLEKIEVVLKQGWVTDDKGRKYYDQNELLTSTWIQDADKWYYLKDDGYMAVDWYQVDGFWYYLGQDGAKTLGWNKLNTTWYYMDTNGRMTTGWQKIGNSWYYFGGTNDGKMATDWKKVGGSWYYFGGANDGKMATGWKKVSGNWYYMDPSGKMGTGWRKSGGAWYYMASSGKMVTGWQKVGGVWYHMDASGKMATGWRKVGGAWYYLASSGKMVTGWQKVGEYWYYMNSDGKMATGWIVQGGKRYYLDLASGRWDGR